MNIVYFGQLAYQILASKIFVVMIEAEVSDEQNPILLGFQIIAIMSKTSRGGTVNFYDLQERGLYFL